MFSNHGYGLLQPPHNVEQPKFYVMEKINDRNMQNLYGSWESYINAIVSATQQSSSETKIVRLLSESICYTQMYNILADDRIRNALKSNKGKYTDLEIHFYQPTNASIKITYKFDGFTIHEKQYNNFLQAPDIEFCFNGYSEAIDELPVNISESIEEITANKKANLQKMNDLKKSNAFK